jgi:hypothetical protein
MIRVGEASPFTPIGANLLLNPPPFIKGDLAAAFAETSPRKRGLLRRFTPRNDSVSFPHHLGPRA